MKLIPRILRGAEKSDSISFSSHLVVSHVAMFDLVETDVVRVLKGDWRGTLHEVDQPISPGSASWVLSGMRAALGSRSRNPNHRCRVAISQAPRLALPPPSLSLPLPLSPHPPRTHTPKWAHASVFNKLRRQ